MHRVMRENMPNFQGSRREPRIYTRARIEVRNNIARLDDCRQSIKEELILAYHFILMGFNEMQTMRAIEWMRKGDKNTMCEKLVEETITLMIFEIESPSDTQTLSVGKQAVTRSVYRMMDVYWSCF